MQHATRAVLVLTAVLLASSRRVSGAFVNGVETFPGTTFDTSTWEQTSGTVVQNNGLTITSGISGLTFFGADVTTRSVTVGVGQGVRADVTINSVGSGGPDLEALILTNNSLGTSNTSALDSKWLIVAHTLNGPSQGQGNRIFAQSSQLFGATLLPTAQPIGATYTYQIDRLSLTSAHFAVYNGTTLLGEAAGTTDPMPADLYISLLAANSSVTFHNVTIVPEPACAACLGLALFVTVFRRERRGRRDIQD